MTRVARGIAAIALSRRLVRGGGRDDMTTALLSALAVSLCTALVLLTASVWVGIDRRDDRQAWTVPLTTTPASAAVASPPTAVQSTRTEYWNRRPITVVTLGAMTSHAVPAPPGLSRFPEAGETWLSPALRDLARTDPRGLGARWPARIGGTIGQDALAYRGQLVAIVGARLSSSSLHAPVAVDAQHPTAQAGPVTIHGFARTAGSGADTTLRGLALVASVLVVVPAFVLAGAAARLGLARRHDRFAALRLVGASRAQVVTMLVAESAAVFALGAVVGAVAYALSLPLVAQFAVDGGPWFVHELWLGLGTTLAVLAGVVLTGMLCAASTLRRVVINPLGVAHRHPSPGRHAWRAVVFVSALAAYLHIGSADDPSTAVVIGGLALVLASVSVIGPWVVVLLARLMALTARGPARLLAARRLLDDPRAGWRAVGGLVVATFVAGFLALLPTSSATVVWGHAGRLDVAVPAAHVDTLRSEAEAALRSTGLPREVGVSESGGALLATSVQQDGTDRTAYLTIPVDEHDRERVRTVVGRVLPEAPAATGLDVAAREAQFGVDVSRASLAVLAATFVVAAVSIGISAAAGVVERGDVYRRLHLAGAPLGLLDRARRMETTAPALVLVAGSLTTGVVCAAPVTRLGLGSTAIDSPALIVLATTVVAGAVATRLAPAASRPLLRAAISESSAPGRRRAARNT